MEDTEEIHRCLTKKSPIWCVLLTDYGDMICMGCGKKLNEKQVHQSALNKLKKKLERGLKRNG